MAGKFIKGKTDLGTICPELIKEWHPTKNGELTPWDVTAHCSKKVWWVCSACGHEWEAYVANRSKGHGCPECAKRVIAQKSIARAVEKGINDLKSQYPDIAEEWDYSKNAITPDEISTGSGQKVWWKCKKGHEWKTSVNVRTRGNNCPYCCGVKVWTGYNDLATLRPDLVEEWDYDKNDISPKTIGIGSCKKVWWKCKNGHSYSCVISSRSQGTGCAYCSGRNVLKGENDLKTVYPSLAAEWNYERNKNLTPSDIKAKSSKKVWWKCEYGHEWQATVVNRAYGRGCPECTNAGTSMVEQGVAYYLSKLYEVKQREKVAGCELDIYLPEYSIGIEYDGIFYHSSEESQSREDNKNRRIISNNITLIRIKESRTRNDIENNIIYYQPDGMRDNYSKMISTLLSLLSEITSKKEEVFIDTDKDIIAIRELYSLKRREESLAKKKPDLAKEWNYKKNGRLSPDMFYSGSAQKVWWKCKYGHEWRATINSRDGGNGCPYCSGRKVTKGVNDLATLNPEILDEWDYSKNTIRPDEISTGTPKGVWWVCPQKHSYKATPYNRIKKNCGCPICSNRVVQKGFNDLKTLFPDIAEEWDYEKNMNSPDNVLAGSHSKVWWICKKGHSFRSAIENRTRAHTGCPICAGRSVSKGENDLLSNYPDIAKEWDYDKNGDLKPTDVSVASNKKVWWKCEYGHEWETAISHRTNGREKTKCPYCAGQRTITGVNDLKTVNPKLAREWNYEKNGKVLPEDVMPKSGKRVWWKCPECGYEWDSTVVNRSVKKSGCPKCKHKWIND